MVMHNEYMLKMLRLAGMGLLLWILPSAASLGFYNRSGKLNINFVLLSALITAIFSILGSCFLFRCCRSVSGNSPQERSLTVIILFLYPVIL